MLENNHPTNTQSFEELVTTLLEPIRGVQNYNDTYTGVSDYKTKVAEAITQAHCTEVEREVKEMLEVVESGAEYQDIRHDLLQRLEQLKEMRERL